MQLKNVSALVFQTLSTHFSAISLFSDFHSPVSPRVKEMIEKEMDNNLEVNVTDDIFRVQTDAKVVLL